MCKKISKKTQKNCTLCFYEKIWYRWQMAVSSGALKNLQRKSYYIYNIYIIYIIKYFINIFSSLLYLPRIETAICHLYHHLPSVPLAQWRRTAVNHQNGTGRVKSTKKRDARKNISFFVVVPGLEPGKAGPESAVLPLHHTPNLIFSSALLLNCGCKGTTFSRIAKTFSNFFIKILKKNTFHVSKSNKKYYLCNQIIHYNH